MKSSSPREFVEPVRLLAGGGTGYERRLLESADLDVMPSATPERIARALAEREELGARSRAELRAGSMQAGQVQAGQVQAATRRWVRLGTMGGLGGLGLAVVLFATTPSSAPPEASNGARSTPPASAPAPVELPPSARHADPSVDAPIAPLADVTPAPAPSRAAAIPRTPRRPSARHAGPEQAADGLLEEVRLLERARSALRAGQSRAARSALEEYRARFAHGELAFEAELLEAERSNAAGDAARARLLAGQLLARPGAARYRPRLERLLGSDRTSADMDARRSNP